MVVISKFKSTRPLPIFSIAIYQYEHKEEIELGDRGIKFAVLLRKAKPTYRLTRIVTAQVQVTSLLCLYGYPNLQKNFRKPVTFVCR